MERESFAFSGSSPLTLSTLSSARYRSHGFRRTNLSAHVVAGPQAEALYLRRRDVDVVRAGEIAPVLAAQKSVAFGQDLEHAVAVQHDVGVEKILLDLEDEILLP